MEMEKNEKVLAMYHAVWHLIEEGKDISRIKVSDITECAGIGKGTAYEYFRSKEEIVEKAVHYNTALQFQMLHERIREQNSYRDGLEVCFDWIAETRDRRHLILQFMRRTEGYLQVPACFCEEQKGEKASMIAMVEGNLKEVIRLGRKEGLVRAEVSDELAALQILSQLLGFFVYQECADLSEQEDILKTKDFLCGNIIESLR